MKTKLNETFWIKLKTDKMIMISSHDFCGLFRTCTQF